MSEEQKGNDNCSQEKDAPMSRIRKEKEPPLKQGQKKRTVGDLKRKLKSRRSPRSPK